uniref:PID domain-containing protein n=1 Tax=Heterorhabditis bacteriophora TaxID=37862 RepID=A0A1I7XAN5_HETBA
MIRTLFRLSIWSNGILLEYIEGDKKSETAFFPINTLHYCAAVRYVNVSGYSIEGGGERFLPLDSPFANIPDSPHPPIFAAILRRTTGVKVLECHGFICTNNKAANALVRCCFHAYADSIYLKIDDKIPGLKAIKEGSTGERSPGSPQSEENNSLEGDDHVDRAQKGWERRQQDGDYDSVSISSSLVKGGKKAASERGGVRSAIVPYLDQTPRRSGSDVDLFYGERDLRLPPFPNVCPMPPPGTRLPHGMPFHPSPPHMFRPPLMHPPHMMPPPPPPPLPHMIPPPGMRFPPGMRLPPPPPHMFPPMMHPPFFPPPRGFFMSPPPFGMPPFRPASPGEGPIITGPESVYGTIPRRSAYEEPVYMPGSHVGPPEASYQPGNYPSDHYESYYDTYKKRTLKKDGSSIASTRPESSSLWEQYEAGIYKKPHMNEKAFGGTLKCITDFFVQESTAAKETNNATLNRSGNPEHVSQTVETEV